MAGLTPLPPTIIHTSTRLTHAQAHAQLQDFLTLAENDAAYRPDSTLTERGPQSASTGANPNLTLHHLRRILQGLEGKRIGGLQDVGRFFGNGAVSAGVGRRLWKKKSNVVDGLDGGDQVNGGESGVKKRKFVENRDSEDTNRDVGVVAATGERNDWQEKEEFELAQEEGGLEILDDDRNPGMSLEQPKNAAEADEMVGVEVARTGKKVKPTGTTTADSKEARKAAKKARNKEEQRKKGGAGKSKT